MSFLMRIILMITDSVNIFRLKKGLLIIFSLFLFTSAYSEPLYHVNNLKIQAKINSDGSVDVDEFVEYDADNINGIIYNVDYKGYGELKNLEIFYEKENEFIPAVKSNTHNKGTYSVNDSDELAEIKLYYPMEKENKWFLFSYTLSEGVTVYRDIAQFNRKMAGQGWQTDIDNVEVKIILPEKVSKEKIKAFGHGALTGTVDIINESEIVYKLKDYYSGEFVETNILFPKNLVFDINPAVVKDENGYEKIMEMEMKLADRADLQRKFSTMKNDIEDIVFYFWCGWIIFVLGFAYIKNRRKHKVADDYEPYFSKIPDNLTPAAAGAIVYRGVKPCQLLATVMDLVRRDVFEMIEDKENNRTILRKKSFDIKSLKNYERFVVEWYIDELGNGTEVSMEEVEEFIKSRKNAVSFGRKYEKWKSMVEADLKEAGFKKEKPHKLPTFLGILTGILGLPLGIFSADYFGNEKFIIFTFTAFPIIVFTISGRRYSLEAEKLRAKCLAFKKFLVNYGNLEEAKLSSIYIWENYFVYAIAMGVSEEAAKGYKKIFRESDLRAPRYNRIPIMRMYDRNSRFRNIEQTIFNAVDRGTRELAKSRPSSRGSGGGFSSGSSRGGGSRGGGGAF